MTSLRYREKKRRKYRLRRLWVTFIDNGLVEDNGIVHPYRGVIGSTKLPDMTSLTGSRELQNAIKYCIKARKTGAAGKELNNSATV